MEFERVRYSVLLHEWLVNLTAPYDDAYRTAKYTRGNLTTSQIDVAFTQCPQLQSLPRLVFALLWNPLLCFHEEGVHPDYWIYLQCLFRVTISTWKVAGRPPNDDLEIDEWLSAQDPADIYVFGKMLISEVQTTTRTA